MPVLRAGTRLRLAEVPGHQPALLTSVLWDTPAAAQASGSFRSFRFALSGGEGSPAGCSEKPILNAGAGNGVAVPRFRAVWECSGLRSTAGQPFPS